MKVIIIVILFIPILGYSQSIQALIDSSSIVVEGKVLSRHEIKPIKGWDRIAKVEVLRVFKGEYSKKTLDIYYHERSLHSMIHFSKENHFIAFLSLTDSVAETLHNHNGKFDFESEITTDFPIFLSSYITSKSEEDKLEILFKYLDKGQEFSVLALDMLSYQKKLNRTQQQKLLNIVNEKTSQIIQNMPNNNTSTYYSQCFIVTDYDLLFLCLKGVKVRNEAVKLLKQRLTVTKSRIIAENSLWLICDLASYRTHKLKKELKIYSEKILNFDDSINTELLKIIKGL